VFVLAEQLAREPRRRGRGGREGRRGGGEKVDRDGSLGEGGTEGGREGGKGRGWLSGLKNLVTLDVSHNLLVTLEGVEECTNLTTLLVAKNRLGMGGKEGGREKGEEEGGGGVEESKDGGEDIAVQDKVEEVSALTLPTIITSSSPSSSFSPSSSSFSLSEATERAALLPLASLPSLHTLDLSHNHLTHATRVLLRSLHPSLLPALLSLTLEGNPFLFPNEDKNKINNDLIIKNKNDFRKLCLLTLPQLKYLDRPIFPMERAVAEGWREGGREGGEGAREAWVRREQEGHRESLRVYREWAGRVRREGGREGGGEGGPQRGNDDEDEKEGGGGMGVEGGGGGEEAAAAAEEVGEEERLEQGKKAAAAAAAAAVVAEKVAEEEDEGKKEGGKEGGREGKLLLDEGEEGEEVPPLFDVAEGRLVENVE